MKLLALDSSGLVASAALITEDSILAEYTVNYKKTHSQTLLPMVDEIVRMTEEDLTNLTAIAVAAGPGSFTGLRIGSATAKGLGLALDKPLVSVSTLEGLAYNFYGSESVICPMMDARRKQVYTGLYSWKEGNFTTLYDQTACPVEEILDTCMDIARREGKKVIFLGDGVPVYRDIILAKMEGSRVAYSLAPAHMNRQRAGSTGLRAMELYSQGQFESAADHAPVYLRKSQAEQELIRRGGSLKQ